MEWCNQSPDLQHSSTPILYLTNLDAIVAPVVEVA
jgi:hypothetical protein